MGLSENKFNIRQLDKSKWKTYRFDEIAEKISITVNPSETDLEVYVGLEHIDSGDIHIRRHGKPSDVKGGKLRCSPGDVIFGKRRAYQRKAAIVDFEGICSAHAFVFRARPEVIDPQLFPFFLHSDEFMHRMVDISVGGLSPTINWGDLKEQEFVLPPEDEQKKLAKLVLSMKATIGSLAECISLLESGIESCLENKVHGLHLQGKSINGLLIELAKKFEMISLGELGQVLKGKGIPKSSVKEQGIPCIRYGELYTKHHRIIRGYSSHISSEDAKKSQRVQKNDVLFAASGETIEEIGKSAVFIFDDEVYAGSDILVFRPNEGDGRYLGYLMNSILVREQLNKYGTGTTVMHIYKDDLEKILIPNLPLHIQKEIADELEGFHETLEVASNSIDSKTILLNSFINQVF